MSNILFELLAAHADSDAVVLTLNTPQATTMSYRELFDLTARSVAVLKANGVKPGDRVALQTRKCVSALGVYLACVQAGAVFLPLNTAYTAREIDYFLDDAGVSLFVCDPESYRQDSARQQQQDYRVLTLDGSGEGSFEQAVAQAVADFDVTARGDDDLAAFLYTSGTTGRSKGAMLTQKNLASNTEVLVDYWQFTSTDKLLHALPIYHTHGLFVATNVILATGGSMLFHASFKQDDVIADLPAATAMMGVPTFYTRLLDDDRFTSELTGHMRLFTSGSAPMLPETHTQFEQRTGQRILERYGMTETGMLTSNPYSRERGERKPGTVGHPLPGVELRIMEEQSTSEGKATGQTPESVEAKVGQVGMIEVKGANVFKGYWNMPAKTAEEFTADGFFITGDLGVIDQDGYVSIVGRNKDLIISGGFNVYPKEVELLVDEIEGIKESAVIGLPHRDFGEAVTAVIVLEQQANAGKAGEEQIIASVTASMSTQLARFKQPKQYLVVTELPRNTMGKVQKNELRKRYEDTYS